MDQTPLQELHPLEIRELCFRLRQQIANLDEGADPGALEQQVVDLQEACPHAHPEDSEEKGWRCRDCDLSRPPEPAEEPEVAEAEEPEAADEPAVAETEDPEPAEAPA
ncbi:MAG TPA: hypothetical protein QGG47_03400 [Acidobacteriota bacterium]|nr:hypothetical protein [Acidobacteriota bacterium]